MQLSSLRSNDESVETIDWFWHTWQLGRGWQCVCGCAYVCEVSTMWLFWLCADYRASGSTVLYHCSFAFAPCDFPLQASHGQLFPKQKGDERKGDNESESTCDTVNLVTNMFCIKATSVSICCQGGKHSSWKSNKSYLIMNLNLL